MPSQLLRQLQAAPLTSLLQPVGLDLELDSGRNQQYNCEVERWLHLV